MRKPGERMLELAADAARKGFGLAIDAIEPIPTWNSAVFRIQVDGAAYALRVHVERQRGFGAVRGELAFLRHLRSHGLRVPPPVASVTGADLFVATEDGAELGYDVTGWISGTVRRDGLDTTDAERLGAILAGIHVASSTFTGMPDRPVPVHDELWLVGHAGRGVLEPIADAFSLADRAVLERALDGIRRTLTALEADDLETATIHKDFILGNCLWDNGEPAVIDFAEARIGPVLYDFAPMLTNIGDQPDLREAFLTGYRSLRPLSDRQEAALPALEAVRHISSCFSMIKQARQGEYGPALDVHLPYRVSEVRALLPLL